MTLKTADGPKIGRFTVLDMRPTNSRVVGSIEMSYTCREVDISRRTAWNRLVEASIGVMAKHLEFPDLTISDLSVISLLTSVIATMLMPLNSSP